MEDNDGMRIAIEEAVAAKQEGEWPFGTAIFQEDRLISRNHRRETVEKTVLAHAELHAINDACKTLGTVDLSSCTIYTTNEPCLMCAAAIFQTKTPRIVIGLDRSDLPHLLRERSFRIEHLAEDSGYKSEIVKGVMKREILALFADVRK